MEFAGLIILGMAIMVGLLALSEKAGQIAMQLQRANDLKEDDLRGRGVQITHAFVGDE